MDGERQIKMSVGKADAEEMALFLKAIANPARLRILSSLLDGERQVSDLEQELQLNQAYVSQQLARLRAAGIVEGNRCGREVRYAIVDERTQPVIETLIRFQDALKNGRVDAS